MNCAGTGTRYPDDDFTLIEGLGPIASYERLRPQHRKGSATERDVPHGLVCGEGLPIREQGTNAVAWYDEGIASCRGGEFHAIH
jgi:hypothetical protein